MAGVPDVPIRVFLDSERISWAPIGESHGSLLVRQSGQRRPAFCAGLLLSKHSPTSRRVSSKPSLTLPHKQKIHIFLKPGQRPAYCGSRELEMDSRGAKCSRLRDGNEYADVIE